MKSELDKEFPGGSKKRVTLAGNNFRNDSQTSEDIQVFEDWRSAHRAVLNSFQAILRIRTKGMPISVAQRHKRKSTILNKLKRYPDMQLARMDDIAGCRLIFQSIDELNSFRKEFHKAKFNHILKNDVDKYDYIKKPKATGYRGIHDIYEYNVKSEQGKHLKGLSIEIQYRTMIQHSWATAVELIGFITESQPKFQQGDKRYEVTMAHASEIIARAHEGMIGPLPDLDDKNLVELFRKQEKELNLIRTLRGIEATDIIKSKKKNAILIFSNLNELIIKTYESAPEALRELFKLEKEMPGADIVLVRADSNDEIRLAYKNYFSDAHDFLRLIDEACTRLDGRGI
ncbi:MAG: RelA/SpoT domain-containing protein [Nanoarchaeota archaeon]|nr:RelA/SpoT domain-containing protein [Nanoarchaeota archaeon]